MSKFLQIKDVSILYGVSKRTLRYYEEIGMLKTVRKEESNYRYYDSETLRRLEQILLLRKLDFSIQDTFNILSADNIEIVKELFLQKLITLQKEIHSMTLLKDTIKSVTNIIDNKGVNELSIYEVLREQPYVYKKIERMIDMSTNNNDMIVIEFGEKVIPLANDLIDMIKELRKSMELKHGKEFLRVRVKDNLQLNDSQVILLFKGNEIFNNDIQDKSTIKTVMQCLEDILEKNINEIAI